MAISVRTPKSTREIEPKIVGNFTKRQVICFAIAAAIGAGIDITKPCGNMIVDIGGGTSDT